MRRDDERLADIIEAIEKISVRAARVGRHSTAMKMSRSCSYT
ncbi:MAG TPA: hypothetical protein VGI74_00585 [Streptosporangiaceae bacterium]